MSAAAIALWISTFVSFSWGVVAFFRRTGPMTRQTAAVAVAGAATGAWHAAALATTSAPLLAQAVGCTAIAVGGGLFWWAVAACRERRLTAIFEADLPLYLVRSGPYRFIRHPFYASYTLFWLGGALASGSAISSASAIGMLGLYLRAIGVEEAKFERSALADEYRDYRGVAGMLWPRWRRSREREGRVNAMAR